METRVHDTNLLSCVNDRVGISTLACAVSAVP
jgi:hypothetical protein